MISVLCFLLITSVSLAKSNESETSARTSPMTANPIAEPNKTAEAINKTPTEAEILNGVSIDSFLAAVLSFEGQPYCWPTAENKYSGKGLPTALYKDCHDCSGVVTDGLYIASSGTVDFRSSLNAQGLYRKSAPVATPKKGDLAFYGKGPSQITHVMVCIGDGRVFGATAGTRLIVTPEIAKRTGSVIQYRSKADYRKDLVGFGRLIGSKTEDLES